MTVALDQTLIAKAIASLVVKGGNGRVIDRKTTGTDIFIGAGVTDKGEANAEDIDLCAAGESLLGYVLGLSHWEEIPTQGYFYNDYDHPFAAGLWVKVYVPDKNDELYILSETNTAIALGDKIVIAGGVGLVKTTETYEHGIAMEAKAAAGDTRKYFLMRVA